MAEEVLGYLKKYPAIDENKTLIAKPAFVISLKSLKTAFMEKELVGEFNEKNLNFVNFGKGTN